MWAPRGKYLRKTPHRFKQTDGDLVKKAVIQALDSGFRHLDCAEMYETSSYTGAAITEWLAAGADRSRENLYITQKWEDCDKNTAMDICEQLLQDMVFY